MRWFALFLCLWFVAPLRAQDSVSVSGPFTRGDLTFFLLCANSHSPDNYLTLDEALRNGRAVIHENNSQTLWIENRSDSDLFIQSGEIIKGGQQDRMIASDMIIAAHDTSRELRVFCVEHGRSTKRGAEPIETFSMSPELAPLHHMRILAQNELTSQLLHPHLGGLTAPDPEQQKLFASLSMLPEFNRIDDASQEAVWSDVASVESGLTKSLRDSVTKNVSPTSLELALESRTLGERRQAFQDDFERAAMKQNNAMGVVVIERGAIVSADIYSSHDLFLSMWPKLLRSMVTESLMNVASGSSKVITSDDVLNFLDESEHGGVAEQSINQRTKAIVTKTQAAYRFTTLDTKDGSAVHTAVIAQ